MEGLNLLKCYDFAPFLMCNWLSSFAYIVRKSSHSHIFSEGKWSSLSMHIILNLIKHSDRNVSWGIYNWHQDGCLSRLCYPIPDHKTKLVEVWVETNCLRSWDSCFQGTQFLKMYQGISHDFLCLSIQQSTKIRPPNMNLTFCTFHRVTGFK